MSPKLRMRRWLRSAFLLGGLSAAGCQSCCGPDGLDGEGGAHRHDLHPCPLTDKCATIPPGAMPLPNGTFVHGWQAAQAAKAEADDFVVYLNEWYMGGPDLGPYGLYHVGRIAKALPECAYPVVIQTCPDPRLNAVRQQKVIACLQNAGVTDAHVRVVVGFPEALDLNGAEATRIYMQMLINRGGYGRGLGGGGAGGFGFGGIGGFGYGGFGGFGGVGGFGGSMFGF